MANILLRTLAALPLPWNHRLGAILGWCVYAFSPRYRARLRENFRQSGLYANEAEFRRRLRQCVAEAGKGATELLIAWLRPEDEVAGLVRQCHGWEHAEAARAAGKGIIFITPHLGCYDIAGRFIHTRMPLTVLYRPPKLPWLDELVRRGRERGAALVAPADLRGVRTLLKTLRHRGNVCILPDQAPGRGEGVWVEFFGRPAYTMTLLGRLQQATGAPVVLFFGERLPRGAGYAVWLEPVPRLSNDPARAARQVNAAIENAVRKCPTQYLWSYNRYKVPAGAEPPPDRGQS